MANSPNNSGDRLLAQLLDFLWRQWATLGAPGNRVSGGDWIIDPEALALITTELGRFDSRLLDTAIDWLHAHGQLINLQRLRRLQGLWFACDGRVLITWPEAREFPRWNSWAPVFFFAIRRS